MTKDVHTEHCCVVHGCKYGDEDCSVATSRKPQSYPCERCSFEDIDPSKSSKQEPETSIYNFRSKTHYKLIGNHDSDGLLFVMGFMKDETEADNLICQVYLPSNFLMTGITDFVSSVQGTKKIKRNEWQEITKQEFNELKEKFIEKYKPIRK